MSLSRRQILASAGVVGAGALGIGYWQRRRLRRRSEIRELRDVSSADVPQIIDDPVLPSSVIESSYERAIDRFDEIEPRIEPPFDRYTEEFVDDLRERLENRAPDRVEIPPRGAPAMHYAQREALFTYRRTRMRLVSVLAVESPEETPSERFEEKSAEVRDRIESVEVSYRGELGEAIVAGSTIESAINGGENHLENAIEENDRSRQWRELERATASVEDAEFLAETHTGPAYDDFPAVAERLVDEFERRREAAPDRYEPPVEGAESSFVAPAISALKRPMQNLGASPYSAPRQVEDGRDGRAAHTYALLLPTVTLYEAFADVPDVLWWEEIDYELEANPEDLRTEKEASIDAAGDYLDAEDPLVDHLAAVSLGAVRDTDDRLQSLTENVTEFDDREWATRRDRALLQYEAARRYAEAIGEALDVLDR